MMHEEYLKHALINADIMENTIFQQDCAPPHLSRIAKSPIVQMFGENVIPRGLPHESLLALFSER